MKISYVTADGMKLIKSEFDYLWGNLRPKVTEKLAWAASLGDRSENADYQYNKRYLREIDFRIQKLSDILEVTKVLDRSKEGIEENIILFGAYVEIENDNGDIRHFRIVGKNEIYNREHLISNESPMAKGLLGKTIDDEATVFTPNGEATWYINKISYQHEEWFGEIGEPEFKFTNREKDVNSEVKIMTDEEIAQAKKSYLELLAKNSNK